MLKTSRQHHLISFDSQRQYLCSYCYQVIRPESKTKRKQEQAQLQIEIKDEYKLSYYIENEFTYQWKSEYFDLEVQAKEVEEYGGVPFSLETYLDIFRDPRIWDIVLRPRNDELQGEEYLGKEVGKLIITTSFSDNPMLLPVHCRNNALQSYKTIKVISNALNPNQQVICSGDFLSQEYVSETDVYHVRPGENISAGFNVYTFELSNRVSCANVCIIKGQFTKKQLVHRGRNIHIYSGNGHEVQFIPNLQKIMKRLKFIDQDTIIFQHIDTQLEDSHKIVFFSDLTTLYAKIFRSYLYSRVYDQWIIEGMVHYLRDNRHFQDCMLQLTELLTQGEQFFPLSNPDYSFDHVWKVKAKFIYHVLENLSGNSLTTEILEYSAKKKLTSPMIIKKMKDKFGLQSIKLFYEQQFVHSTGMNRIFYEVQHLKRDHKLKITLRQKALVCGIFRKYNRFRIKLEQSFGLLSPVMESIKRKNEGKKNEMCGPLAVPKFLKCLPYFIGEVNVQIENSEPFKEMLQEQNITERIKDDNFSIRSNRRIVGKGKDEQGSDTVSWMILDSSLVFPAVYKGKNLKESLIQSLVKRVYESQIEELKVLNSISIKEHSRSQSICRHLIEKVKIKQKDDCKISVKRKILQLLPNFISHSTNPAIWDEIVELLRLYEPVCYDYSEEGNIFLHSLIESVGSIGYNVKFGEYFEEFHRVFLAISKYHHCVSEERFEEIHKKIFRSMMKWLSKYSFKVLEQARDYLELTLTDPKRYLQLVKIIVENVLPYMDMMGLQPQLPLPRNIRAQIHKHIQLDPTGTIRSVDFQYTVKINQTKLKPLDFLNATFSELEHIQNQHPTAYDKCLHKFKDVLSRNKHRYGLQIQLEHLNENQNYFLAEYLWNKLCSRESLYDARVRLHWMKIYRIFYFYFTPIATMVKLNKNLLTQEFNLNEVETIEVLNNIRDFLPDIKWFSVYDSSGQKKRKTEIAGGRRRKRDIEDFKFSEKNMFTVFVQKNPGKSGRDDLAKQALEYLRKEYENKEIDTGLEKYKKIIEKIKEISQKLKRGNNTDNYTYEKIKSKVFNVISEAKEPTDMAVELYSTLERTVAEIEASRRQRQQGRNMETSVYIPREFLRKDQM